MKLRKPNKVLCIILSIVSFFTFCGAGRQLPTVSTPMLKPTESFVYINHLEREKQYERLLILLKKELASLQLMDFYAKEGIRLTEYEKIQIKEISGKKESEDAVADFFRNNRLTPDAEDYDLEGKLFIIDNIAEIYTYKIVDFKKANEYNEWAKKLYDKMMLLKEGDIPVSTFYNNKRHFYYFEGAGYKIQQAILDEVRNSDLQKLGIRVEERTEFLASKLGEIKEAHSSLVLKKGDENNKRLLAQLEHFIKEVPRYDAFQQNYLLAQETYNAFPQNEDTALLEKAIEYCEKALESAPDKSLENQTRLNSLYHWLGLSYLKLNDTDNGIKNMELFLAGIDEYERLLNRHYEKRKKTIEQVNKEQGVIARNKAIAFGGLGILMIAGGYFATKGKSKNTFVPISFSFVTHFGVDFLIKSPDVVTVEIPEKAYRKKLAKLITPYSLRLNRYLDKHEMVEYFYELGKAYDLAGFPEKALNHFEEAVLIIERQRSTIFTEKQRISFFGKKQELYDSIIHILISLQKHDKAVEFAERARSRAFVDILGSSRVELKNEQQTEAYRNSIVCQAELDSLISEKDIGKDQLKNLVSKTLRSLKIAEDTRRLPANNQAVEIEFVSLSTVQTLSSEEIIKLSDSDIAIVEFYVTNNHVYIFIVCNGKIKAVSLPADYEQLAKQVNGWRQAISNCREDKIAAKYFYDLLIAPVEKELNVSQIIIIPHKILHYLPFQALFDGKQHLIERFAISYVPSATVLGITNQKQTTDKGNMLAFGNPTLDLVFAEEEASVISKLFDKSTLLVREQATEFAFKNNGKDFDFIHLATHGMYDDTNPLNSRIILHSDNKNDGDLLTAELFSIPLNASLVTLSACESGLSKNDSGDELVGLQRGLMFSGTRSIISSLWKVDDQATNFLMENFYRNLLSMPKNKALQKAQIATKEKYPESFYWASFCLTGSIE